TCSPRARTTCARRRTSASSPASRWRWCASASTCSAMACATCSIHVYGCRRDSLRSAFGMRRAGMIGMPQAAGLQAPQVSADDPLLAIENLRVVFGPRGREQVAVDDVTLTLAPGEVLGVVGE